MSRDVGPVRTERRSRCQDTIPVISRSAYSRSIDLQLHCYRIVDQRGVVAYAERVASSTEIRRHALRSQPSTPSQIYIRPPPATLRTNSFYIANCSTIVLHECMHVSVPLLAWQWPRYGRRCLPCALMRETVDRSRSRSRPRVRARLRRTR